jgi:hypothetical protein
MDTTQIDVGLWIVNGLVILVLLSLAFLVIGFVAHVALDWYWTLKGGKGNRR